MNIGILLPGFSSDENDWAIPVQLNLVREMAKNDDVRVLTLRYPHRRDQYSIFGATVYSLGVGQVRGLGRLNLWMDALLTLRRLHREKPFDVLHAMWADETGLIAAWAGRWLGIQTVVSIAGGELARLDDIAYGLQRSTFSRWIVGQALGADRVIAPCSYAKNLIQAAGYNISAEKTRIITLGVDTEIFHPSADTLPQKHLIHVASLVGVKDQATLLRALTRLDQDVTLSILGVGPEQERLQIQAAQSGIANRVKFVGAVEHLDLPRHYQGAALNVLSSRHEGLGMVTLEAAACAVPTISTTVGLLPDVPAMGICVPVGDDEALAAAIRDLLNDDQRGAALSKSAYETARTQFTIQHTVQQFRALYSELFSGVV
jgi:glycosyltransferase involved in cell wall biosynthesis